jgi:hypothetical protein
MLSLNQNPFTNQTPTPDEELCQICHRSYATVQHHIFATSLGGSNESSNLLHVCSACHQKIHPWLNNKGLKAHCQVIGADILGTYYGHTKRTKRYGPVLENYSREDIDTGNRQLIQKAETENAQGCPANANTGPTTTTTTTCTN